MKEFRWGFCGAGPIAHKVMVDFPRIPGARLAAVFSRDGKRAEDFARQYGAEHWYTAPEAMLEARLDAVYVATPHTAHLEMAELFLKAGIPVLCEKPLTANAAQARQMIGAARQNDTFLMEGFWTRLFPVNQRVRNWVQSGAIGPLRAMQGMFAVRFATRLLRLVEPAMAGGALLDIGCYLLNYAGFVAGEPPQEWRMLTSRLADEGVDSTNGMLFKFRSGVIASGLSTFEADGWSGFSIMGEEGHIEVSPMFIMAKKATLYQGQNVIDVAEDELDTAGYHYEFIHVQECVASGAKESPIMPLAESLRNMEILDDMRRQTGISFPFEAK